MLRLPNDKRPRRIRACIALQGGQAIVEYVVIVLLVVLALALSDGSAISQLLAAIRSSYAAFSYALSLP